uniref:Meiotic recombination protein rec14 n=1 Tax=Lygus hesperus TaxID=30085 RepID=A0A0A9ZFR8_LYGHE
MSDVVSIACEDGGAQELVDEYSKFIEYCSNPETSETRDTGDTRQQQHGMQNTKTPHTNNTYTHIFTSVTSRYAPVDDPSFSSTTQLATGTSELKMEDAASEDGKMYNNESIGSSFMTKVVMRNTAVNGSTSSSLDDIRSELLAAAGEIDVNTNDTVRQK